MQSAVCCVWHLGEHRKIELSAWWHVKVLVAREERGRGRREGTLSVELSCQMVPILETNLKDLSLFYLRHQQHVVEGLKKDQSHLNF